jgi:NAD+ kinase
VVGHLRAENVVEERAGGAQGRSVEVSGVGELEVSHGLMLAPSTDPRRRPGDRRGTLRGLETKPRASHAVSQIGLVVHPSRAIDGPLDALKRWTGVHEVSLVQVRNSGQRRQVAVEGEASDCDVIVSIGGDGTTLAALRAGAGARRPVLGVACGSLGVLTAVAAGGIEGAVERFSTGDWVPRPLPALDVGDGTQAHFALNDAAIVRGGGGQLRVAAKVDGTLFARLAGDGCVVSTPVGSSAYALAAGGPLLTPDAEAFVLTPLPTHGGYHPPLVVSPTSTVELEVMGGYGGSRLEIDGQVVESDVRTLTLEFRPAAATLVGFADQEPFLTGLRRRNLIMDSPRILAEGNPEAGETTSDL